MKAHLKLEHRTRNVIILSALAMYCLVAAGILIKRHLDSRVFQATSTNTVVLKMPANISTTPIQDFDVPISLSTSGKAIRGVDVIVNFDKTALQLLNITPTGTSAFQTYTPVSSPSGAFDVTRVIANSTQSGQVEFGAVTFDWVNQKVTPAVATDSAIANLRFHPLKTGQTTVSFVFNPNALTTDTNIVSDTDPPQELLQSTAQLVNAQISVVASSPTPTPAATPNPTPTPSPTASIKPTATPTPTSTPSATPKPTPSPSSAPLSSATPTPSNLITNSGFESGNVSSWSNSKTTVTNTDIHSGTYSARMNKNNAYISQNIKSKLIPGVTYVISAYVKVTSTSSNGGVPELRAGTSSGLSTNEFGKASAQNSTSLGWQKLTFMHKFTSSELTNSSINIGLRNFGSNGVTIADDVSVLAQ